MQNVDRTGEVAEALYEALKAVPKALVIGRPPDTTLVDGTFDLRTVAAAILQMARL